MAEPLLLAALLDAVAVGVAHRDAYEASFGRSLAEQLVEARVCLVQKEGGVDEYVDALSGLSQHVDERGDGELGSLFVERHEVGADGASGACLADGRPQGLHVRLERLSRPQGRHPSRSAIVVDPSLDRLGVDAHLLREAGAGPAPGNHDRAQSLVRQSPPRSSER